MLPPSGRRTLVTVAMPAFNAAATIEQAIDSVLDQTYPAIEIIVIDDGSIDRTPAILDRYRDRVRVVSQANAGLGQARRRGMELASGSYIAWLDADDWCDPMMVESRVAVLEARPDLVAVSTGFAAFDAAGPRPDVSLQSYYANIGQRAAGLAALYPEAARLTLGDAELGYRVGHLYPDLLLGNVVHPPTVMFRRTLIARCGLPDSDLARGSDWAYLLRIARCGPMAVIPSPLLHYRLSPTQRSASANLCSIQQGIIDVMERALAQDPSLLATHADLMTWRLGNVYANAVESFAQADKAKALGCLIKALRYHRLPHPRALAKLLLPGAAVDFIRWSRAQLRPLGTS